MNVRFGSEADFLLSCHTLLLSASGGAQPLHCRPTSSLRQLVHDATHYRAGPAIGDPESHTVTIFLSMNHVVVPMKGN